MYLFLMFLDSKWYWSSISYKVLTVSQEPCIIIIIIFLSAA